MQQLKYLLKNGRVAKRFTTRQVSEALKIDQALVSKFENGLRRPTRTQVVLFSELFEIDQDEILLCWLTEKILAEIQNEPLGLKALKAAETALGEKPNKEVDDQFQKLLREMDALKGMLGKKD
ncbi:helix-turn-helix domain-containing protein [Flavobacterium selenitireducens]|uniref:helix-turn-helix domain-containing protein n=1 Tax=Flavobacterium selenitireducens TaxID=2722704 RepID=UPI00168BFCB5|nr:helix-turn-helix transcriptional regulator [Flavobacterium selenitireducens]MBD3582971.1 helix-turn-helix transcriptional regulator [Flavobacterium selenitireducens]